MAAPRLPHIPRTTGNDAGLRGRLEQFGLATVLSFLDLERRSGELMVTSLRGTGRIRLRGGQMLSARIEGSRRVNRAAIYEMVAWDSGYFAFTQDDLATAADEIGAPTTLILFDAARRSDEAAAAPAF
jgi:two-component system, OmpR family, response regulator